MPLLFLDKAPGAPALLKSAVENAGYYAVTIDLSLEFFINQCKKNVDTYNTLGCVFRPGELPSLEAVQASDQWVTDSIIQLKKLNPAIIGLSVFTNFQHRSTYLLAQAIRIHMPTVKLIAGGMGLEISTNSMSELKDIKQIDLLKPFHQYIKEKNLVDYVVRGSGLDELITILETELGHRNTEIVNYSSEGVIFNTPIPNYDNYKINEYLWNQVQSLPITGSKGCVRACTFCDIPGQFGRFKYRTGEDIAQEMLYLNKKHGIQTFEFTDSLVNGSFKAFRQWLTIIADYNDHQPETKKIHWFGQYICRPQSQVPNDIYELMKRSGVVNLVIGVESGSNIVLEAMKKKITVQDVFDELALFDQYQIKAHFLMLSGFYNETPECYLDTLKFIVKCQRYLASGTITKLSMGHPLYINNNTYLYDAADQLGLIIDPYDDTYWRSIADPTNDFPRRALNRLTTQVITDMLGVPISGQAISNLHQMLEKLKKYKHNLQKTLDETTQVAAN
jgi:radical SAM superfamily enzyme YgiQ (UPF0313 family)